MWMNLIGNARRSPTRGSRARSPGSRRACRGQSPSLHQLVDDRQSGEPRQLYGVSGDQQADSRRQPLFPRRSTFTAAISVRRSDSPVINSAFGGQAGRSVATATSRSDLVASPAGAVSIRASLRPSSRIFSSSAMIETHPRWWSGAKAWCLQHQPRPAYSTKLFTCSGQPRSVCRWPRRRGSGSGGRLWRDTPSSISPLPASV